MINFPKTGSTFVRTILKQLYADSTLIDRIMIFFGLKKKAYFLNLWLPSIRNNDFKELKKDEHGIYQQIPDEHKHKKIVSVSRNLFERMISIYVYGNWQNTPWADVSILKNANASFPNINFEEFVRLWTQFNPLEFHPKVNRKLPIGPATSQFILFYFKEPFKVLRNIDEKYILSDAYKKDIADIRFLNQKNLNHDLYQFLKEQGFDVRKIKFILDAEKVNVSTSKNNVSKDYFSKELRSFVIETESFLLRILHDKGINNAVHEEYE
jgi:hypothetical protein